MDGADVTTDEDAEFDDLIAVVGMAGRYPESPNLTAFWDNLRNGRDCLHTFSDEELDALGIPTATYGMDNFIRRGTILPNRDEFDSRFFGYTPKQAGVMDPQARIFLETSYEALETAGYNPFDTGHSVGVFAGSNPNDYALLLGVSDPRDSLGAFDQMIGVDRDFVATRVSHNLGLTGPAMTIQTACSTSLVTVHAAAQSLLSYECSMALAGGVSINLRQGVGYFYQQGMILSPTGECRAFDANAQGTTLGQGCGVVLLKRLADAQDDGDHIIAVVRATAINNDGSAKISYTAPSEDGQTAVIAMAHGIAGIESDSIGYVETHGTGTLLGDPIEIAALTRAFKPGTDRTQYCAIGSAKTNFGHTDAAAGITGFIKAALSLYHREIVPSIHFETPNPDIDFANSPFYVSTELKDWPEGPTPRRAGVSAFGIGGTNAHVVLEEAPPTSTGDGRGSDGQRVLLLSAKTSTAADNRVAELAELLDSSDGDSADITPATASLADVDHTLRNGRPQFEHRRAVVVGPDRSLAATLRGDTDGTVVRGTATAADASLVWLFAGQGAQYPRMGLDLYNTEPVFAEAVDRVATLLQEPLGLDIRTLIFVEDNEAAIAASAEELRQTSITQPALFVIEYAMASLLRSWGMQPTAVIGHSIGEYAAAVEAGILSWQDGAKLVVERGRLMQSMEPGSMLSVSLSAAELEQRLPADVELATDNSSALSVASGPTDVIEAFAAALEQDGVSAQVLHTSHAFHSAMMDDAAAQFGEAVAKVSLSAPTIPLISNVTGRPITDAEATDPLFWASQIRRPVRFGQCLLTSTESGPVAFLELGPGRALSTFASAHDGLPEPVLAAPTMRHPRQDRDDRVALLEAMGRLWAAGIAIDWDPINGETSGRRVPLPTYPFDRAEAWLPPHRHVLALPHFGPPSENTNRVVSREPLDRWLYSPSWRREPMGDIVTEEGSTVLLAPVGDAGDELVAELQSVRDLIVVRPGLQFTSTEQGYEANPTDDDSIAAVFAAIAESGTTVANVIHAWSAGPGPGIEDLDDLETALAIGVHSVLACARGLSGLSRTASIRLDILTSGAFDVTGSENIRPDAAALLGPTKVVPLEYSGLTTRLIDIPDGISSPADRAAAITELRSPIDGQPSDAVIALRGNQRWTPTVAVRPTSADGGKPVLTENGRYLIVGGLGGVGLSIARYLAETYKASLILTSRSGRPTVSDDADLETAKRLELLDEIEDLATDLQVVAVDATDEQAMVDLVERIEADAGPLNGAIVAAGVADQHGAIHRRSRDDMTKSISSKVHGSMILERALSGRQLDFVLLSSSIAATLYHNRFAQVGYVTGNAFAESFALRSRQRGVNAYTVAWDDWLDIGMSVRAAQDFSADFGTDVDLVDQLNSFSPADGVQLFDRALRSDEPVLLVSPTNLEDRIEDDVNVTSPFLEQATGDDGSEEELTGATLADMVASVWTALLGFESFQPTDDFFELGGDSLQAARMADRLSRALGTEIPIDVIFDAPVLTKLVEVLESMAEAGPSDSEQSTSRDRGDEEIVLGPAQRRYLERDTAVPEHFNTSVLLRPDRPLEVEHVRTAVTELLIRHEALRLTIVAGSDGGQPHQVVAPVETAADPLTVVDLASTKDQTEALKQLEASAADVQRSLDLETGPIFRVVLYSLPDGSQRLLVVVHHLMCDRVSLLLMMDNLDATLLALSSGQEAGPVQAVTSVLDWVEAQADAGRNADELGLTDHWADRPWDLVQPIPVDHPSSLGENRNDSVDTVELEIGPGEMAGSAADQVRPDEVALLALMKAIGAWGEQKVTLVDVLGHGRRLPVPVDVSRSVGMFITYSPVLLDHRIDSVAAELDSLRGDLEHGWSFDVLRYCGAENVQPTFQSLPQAEVLFNFVGKAVATDGDALLTTSDEARGPESDASGRRAHLLAVRADVLDDDGLKLVFVYSNRVHERATVEQLAKLTGELIREFRA